MPGPCYCAPLPPGSEGLNLPQLPALRAAEDVETEYAGLVRALMDPDPIPLVECDPGRVIVCQQHCGATQDFDVHDGTLVNHQVIERFGRIIEGQSDTSDVLIGSAMVWSSRKLSW